jgi:hypothetical protein
MMEEETKKKHEREAKRQAALDAANAPAETEAPATEEAPTAESEAPAAE